MEASNSKNDYPKKGLLSNKIKQTVIPTTYLHNLRSINAISSSLSNDLSRYNQILQYGIMDRSKSPAAGSLGSRASLWGPHYPPGCNEDHVLQEMGTSRNAKRQCPLMIKCWMNVLIFNNHHKNIWRIKSENVAMTQTTSKLSYTQ